MRQLALSIVCTALAVTALAGPGNVKPTAKGGSPFYLSGVWVLADSFMDKQDESQVAAPGRLSEASAADLRLFMQAPVLKGEYEAARLKKVRSTQLGQPVDDQGALCLPQGMPNFWVGPYAFEFIQTKQQLNISQEWNEQTRRVYLDARPHPADYDPSFNGHSIGHWEGPVLVIDTVGIRAGGKVGVDGHHSAAMHIVERIRKVDRELIEVEMTAYDPVAFLQPWVAVYRLRHKPGMEMQEYSCEENNRNTVDDNGVTRAGVTHE